MPKSQSATSTIHETILAWSPEENSTCAVSAAEKLTVIQALLEICNTGLLMPTVKKPCAAEFTISTV